MICFANSDPNRNHQRDHFSRQIHFYQNNRRSETSLWKFSRCIHRNPNTLEKDRRIADTSANITAEINCVPVNWRNKGFPGFHLLKLLDTLRNCRIATARSHILNTAQLTNVGQSEMRPVKNQSSLPRIRKHKQSIVHSPEPKSPRLDKFQLPTPNKIQWLSEIYLHTHMRGKTNSHYLA